jgi:hypothetical protein
MIANANAACSPEWNGFEIRLGKNARPVTVAALAGESRLSAWAPSSFWIGL